MAAKFRNNGQTCVTANRIFVHSSIYDEFADKLISNVKDMRVGHGLDSDTTHGPLINSKAVEKFNLHISDAIEQGGRIVFGQKHSSSDNYVQPVIIEANTEMLVFREETFGPLVALFKFSDEQEVINTANKSASGLAGYIYTRDTGRCWRVAEALQVGMVGVNSGVISSEVLPFGGIKASGFGREGSKYGIDEYLNIKSICFA